MIILLPSLHDRKRRGTTLTEVMISVPIAALFGILTVTVLAVSGVLFKNIADETRFRQKAGLVITSLERDLRSSETATIATDYLTAPSATTFNGNCIYITNMTNPVATQNVAYYYYKATGRNWGSIYKDTDTSTAPDPDQDQEIARSMTAFEVRRNPVSTGAEYRIALRGDMTQQRIMGNYSGAGNKMILSTTIRPRRN
ncbi:hypothetical protein IT570_13665 [Candidatus Sumerlaeota bacterium]|nr:hypothetical protein [Candidatus Sumerlaeota bacterium]